MATSKAGLEFELLALARHSTSPTSTLYASQLETSSRLVMVPSSSGIMTLSGASAHSAIERCAQQACTPLVRMRHLIPRRSMLQQFSGSNALLKLHVKL
jgi:hypothetical protein